MALVDMLAACLGRLRHRDAASAFAGSWHQSLRDRASAALKPGPKTWLLARAVSLKAF